MKSWPLLTVAVERESEVVSVRQRARHIAELLGFDLQDRTRIATAVSEVARNAQVYGRNGRTEFALRGRRAPEEFAIRIVDRGPGIRDVDSLVDSAGRQGRGGLGLGLRGARRLMDGFSIESSADVGTTILLSKRLPPGVDIGQERLREMSRQIAGNSPTDSMSELRTQNAELMRSLEILEVRRLEAQHLAEELERTNKGVVALYAELDRRAMELEELNTTLEQRIADGVKERARVEENLRQSQKMEVVGQLTGGIAHDFNNILMIIGGSIGMLRKRVPLEPKIVQLLDAAGEGVARGSAINHQLLAFARRQHLAEEVMKASDLMPSLIALIKRAISEDIKLRVECGKDLWMTRIDQHQLEVAVLNLAINARDAMPGGGQLTLSAANETVSAAVAEAWSAKEGDYVSIAIRDTGEGMPPEVLRRVFEPFFTTKEVGRGTGLGLSQVYGFAQQSGGFVTIESQPGHGAEARIFLPRTHEPAPDRQRDVALEAVEGSADILVVEDDAAVRSTAAGMLRDLGYAVWEASTARAALEAMSVRTFDLVFSDVILPDGMSGPELARAIRDMAPDMPVLLTSGYTAQRLNMSDDPQLPLIAKPYNQEQLSHAIQSVLSGHPARRR